MRLETNHSLASQAGLTALISEIISLCLPKVLINWEGLLLHYNYFLYLPVCQTHIQTATFHLPAASLPSKNQIRTSCYGLRGPPRSGLPSKSQLLVVNLNYPRPLFSPPHEPALRQAVPSSGIPCPSIRSQLKVTSSRRPSLMAPSEDTPSSTFTFEFYSALSPSETHIGCCSVTSDSLQPHGYTTPGFPVLHYLPELAQTHVH